jgi:esterase
MTITSARHLARAAFVDLDGWRAHVVRWGPRSERRVLLLHGFFGHAQSWSHLASELAGRGLEVMALDQRGHGRSARVDRFGSRPMVEDVGALLDALEWPSASIVGQSMGGVNAFLFASAHAERVDRLVVVDIGPEVAPEGASRIRRSTGRINQVFASQADAFAAAQLLYPRAAPELLAARVRHNVVADGSVGWRWRTDARLLDGTAARDDHSTEEKWAAWRSVSCDTLLVHGSVSDVLTPSIIDRMLDARPGTHVVHVDGATHAVPLDRPTALADAVTTYLA